MLLVDDVADDDDDASGGGGGGGGGAEDAEVMEGGCWTTFLGSVPLLSMARWGASASDKII